MTTTRVPDGNGGSSAGNRGGGSRRGRRRPRQGNGGGGANGSARKREILDVEDEFEGDPYEAREDDEPSERIHVRDLKAKSITELSEVAEDLGVERHRRACASRI